MRMFERLEDRLMLAGYYIDWGDIDYHDGDQVTVFATVREEGCDNYVTDSTLTFRPEIDPEIIEVPVIQEVPVESSPTIQIEAGGTLVNIWTAEPFTTDVLPDGTVEIVVGSFEPAQQIDPEYVADLEEQVELLTVENEVLVQEITTLTIDNGLLQTEVDELTIEVEELTTQYNTLTSELQIVIDQLQGLIDGDAPVALEPLAVDEGLQELLDYPVSIPNHPDFAGPCPEFCPLLDQWHLY